MYGDAGWNSACDRSHMIENQERIETELVEKVDSLQPARWWTWTQLCERLQKPAVRYAVLGLFVAFLAFFTVEYLRLARMIDRRLAEGAFSTSTDILSAPETLAAGDALAESDLVGRLERNGYNRTPGNSGGWYEVRANTVQISPRPDSSEDSVRVEFAQGKIASIVSVKDHHTRSQYQLGPELLTNLSGSREKRRLVRFSDIPKSLIQAVTSAEDKRFFQHGGFDYPRVLKAAVVDFRDGRKGQGASTLTMQLARGLWLDPGKSWRRKAEEMLITMHLEHRLTKQQIFEDYANQIYFGRRGTYSINGFGEAAWMFFGKELWQIDTAEAALLAGLVQRPSFYNPYRYPERALSRRNLVLALMRRNGELSDTAYRAAVAAPLKLAPVVDESENSYFISMMNDELQATLGESAKQSRSVVTTLDPELQRAAESAVQSGMQGVDQELRLRNASGGVRPQVALIAMNPHTGEIKALIGGRNYSASQLNHVLSMRQPGSVFKPFVYAAAIDTAVEGGPKTFTPASLLSDDATTFSFDGGSYQPKDFHGDYQGDVTLRSALAQSLNVATVSLAQQVGCQRVVALARLAGLNDNIRPTPSVALGSYETTPLEIAAAYTIFANQGMWVKPTTIQLVRSADGTELRRNEPKTRPALDPRVAYIMLNMMQEVLRSGTGAGVRSRGFVLPAAGKTGTSRDGWFSGFTSELLCVVWVGFDDNRDLNLEGARSALPIWADFMKRAAQIRPYNLAHQFRAPSGVVTAEICDTTGELAGPYCPNVHSEVFISGTQPTSPCTAHQ
jgi:penicillin-binding protein 1B